MNKKKEGAPADSIWQDREVLFDLEVRLIRTFPGEILIERIEHVEDTKGNNGDRGILRVTNLRLVWYGMTTPRINLSVGYNCITGITTRVAKSKLRGQCESLYVMAKSTSGTKFEFIFSCVNPSAQKLFATVIGIHRAYETTKMYRELKMRCALLNEEGKLKLLPLETQTELVEGVWNLSSEQGHLGSFVFTNIRVVWHATLNPVYNVSIPYLHLKSCRVRNSRFGRAIVIETSHQSGEYILGFQVQEDRLETTASQIQALANAYQVRPIFGVTYTRDVGDRPLDEQEARLDNVESGGEVDEETPLRVDAFAAYFTEGPAKGEEQRPIVYSEELGVAIEQLRPGFTIADLWEINSD